MHSASAIAQTGASFKQRRCRCSLWRHKPKIRSSPWQEFFKKVRFQWPQMQFVCGQKAKTHVYVWTGFLFLYYRLSLSSCLWRPAFRLFQTTLWVNIWRLWLCWMNLRVHTSHRTCGENCQSTLNLKKWRSDWVIERGELCCLVRFVRWRLQVCWWVSDSAPSSPTLETLKLLVKWDVKKWSCVCLGFSYIGTETLLMTDAVFAPRSWNTITSLNVLKRFRTS